MKIELPKYNIIVDSGTLPPDIRVIMSAAKKSCKGNSHTIRYSHMLDQFCRGALWMYAQVKNKNISITDNSGFNDTVEITSKP
jgi:hypothetical protein